MKNNIYKYGLLAIIWMVYTLPVLAGPIDPPTDDDPIDPVPVDNWMLLLLFAGITIGSYLLTRYRRKITQVN